jgi:hypothetical protein
MDRSPNTPRDDGWRWHRTVEAYTPDGPAGRILLAAVSGSVSLVAFFLLLVFVVSRAGPTWPIGALLAGSVCAATGYLASLVLWPVYLSLIGNVESARSYRPGDGEPTVSGDERPAETGESDDSLETLKHRYAAGELSDAEFERRIDGLLDAEEVARADEGATGRRSRNALLESE